MQQLQFEAQHRWLRPAEICEILCNYRMFHITSEPHIRPPSTVIAYVTVHYLAPLYYHRILPYIWVNEAPKSLSIEAIIFDELFIASMF